MYEIFPYVHLLLLNQIIDIFIDNRFISTTEQFNKKQYVQNMSFSNPNMFKEHIIFALTLKHKRLTHFGSMCSSSSICRTPAECWSPTNWTNSALS